MSNAARDAYARATKEFPPEALSTDKSRGFALTSIKAQYVRERLNDTFGMMGWTLTGEYKEVPEGVLYFGKMVVTLDGIECSHEAPGFAAKDIGGNKERNTGDLYKSAQTDSLSKCASNFGIGNDVYKGNVKAPNTKY